MASENANPPVKQPDLGVTDASDPGTTQKKRKRWSLPPVSIMLSLTFILAILVIALVGQVNAGKSSVINELLGEQKAQTDVLPQ